MEIENDYRHPDKYYKGLIFDPGDEQEKRSRVTSDFIEPSEAWKPPKGFWNFDDEELSKGSRDGSDIDDQESPKRWRDISDLDDRELCWSCGWNVDHQLHSSYGSRIRIFHTRDNTGLWAIGSQWLIRDQPNDAYLGNDFMTYQFLRNQPNLNISLVKEMRRISEPTDKIHFTLMSRAQGVRLDLIWPTLSQEQKSSYKDQLALAMKQWRKFTAPVPQKVDGSQLDDIIIGHCRRRHPPTCKKIGSTTDEWFEDLSETLRRGLAFMHQTKDPAVVERKLQELKDGFPKGGPYVLTHGDLNLSNIIVKDDKIEAIIDWEMAGYYPWWAERYLSLAWGDESSYEMFKPLWEEVSPSMNADTFRKEVSWNVGEVADAWQCSHSEHPGSYKIWTRPGFCECRPYKGHINWTACGNRVEHVVPHD